MKATFSQKINGKWYLAGEELPSPDSPKPDISKHKIMFMKAVDLKSLAKSEGLEVGKHTATELKEMLIKHFGL